jgi:hypothetical protein
MLYTIEAVPSQQPRGILGPNFLADLKAVFLEDAEKDPDEWVPILAEILDTRRQTIKGKRLTFLAHLKEVYESEVGVDPEEYLPLLASRFNEWRSQSRHRAHEQLAALPEDDPLLCPMSLFGTLGLARLEQAHTSTLAWLLDPQQAHGLKTSLLDALLAHGADSTPVGKVHVHEMQSEYPLFLHDKHLGRIDVYGTGTWSMDDEMPESWLLAIEAKIGSGRLVC